MLDLGIVKPGKTLTIPFSTYSSDDPAASITATGLAVGDIKIYKDASVTQRASTAGFAVSADFDSLTGIHYVQIDLSDNTTAGFFAAGSEYFIAVDSVTVDAGTIRFVAARFEIGYPEAILNTTIATLSTQTSFTLTDGPAENDALNNMWVIIHDVASDVQFSKAFISDYVGSTKTVTLVAAPGFTIAATDNISIMGLAPVQATTVGNTLDVTSGGAAGIDWGNVENPSTSVNLSATTTNLCNTITTYTGNTVQTGDSFARIGANGASLTALAQASVLGALTDAAAADDPTSADTVMQYVKQLVNVLVGSAGVATFPAEAAPANAVSLAEVIRAIHADVTGLNGDAMRGTDSAYTGTPPTAAAISDAVWDEDIINAHTTANTAGLILANTTSLAVGAGGISVVAESATVTTGSETLTYTSTQELDGTTHDIAPSGGNTEIYYQFDVGVTSVCTEIIWHGHAESNGDTYTVKGYDWVSASFKTIGTISANNSTAIITQPFVMTNAMTGTGANAGKVRWQITSSDGTNFSTDFVVAEYTALPEAGSILHSGIAQAGTSNTITLDTGANANDDFYNHAKIVISSGTGLEQERIIVDYVGSTKVATIAPPWVTNPDSTSAFEVEPALAHAETGWATIKVGLAAAGSSTTITLDSNASATDDYYNNDLVKIDSGTGEGQVRYISDYNGTTKVATITPAWDTTPDTTSEYIIEDALLTDVKAIADDTTSATNLAASTLGLETGACEGTPTTTVIQTDLAESTDDHYIGRVIIFTSGAAKGQATDITDYTGSTGTVTVTALTTAPAATDTFVIV